MSVKEPRHPCAHCPFRNDIDPYLEYDRAVEIADSLYAGNIFPCHKTTTHDDDGEYVPTSKERMCAGAAITLMKYDGPNNIMRIFGRLEPGYLEDLEKNAETEPLYEDVEEWIAAHE